jgi:hypothetical protein
MAFTNPRGLPVADIGPTLATLVACTLADYTAGGSTQPAVGDIVTFSATGNWYAKRAPDNDGSGLGRVTKIEKAPSGSELGYLVVEWFDVLRFVELTTDDQSTVTLGQSALKDGDTTVPDNFDTAASGSQLIAVAKSGTSGAGTFVAAVLIGVS